MEYLGGDLAADLTSPQGTVSTTLAMTDTAMKNPVT